MQYHSFNNTPEKGQLIRSQRFYSKIIVCTIALIYNCLAFSFNSSHEVSGFNYFTLMMNLSIASSTIYLMVTIYLLVTTILNNARNFIHF